MSSTHQVPEIGVRRSARLDLGSNVRHVPVGVGCVVAGSSGAPTGYRFVVGDGSASPIELGCDDIIGERPTTRPAAGNESVFGADSERWKGWSTGPSVDLWAGARVPGGEDAWTVTVAWHLVKHL